MATIKQKNQVKTSKQAKKLVNPAVNTLSKFAKDPSKLNLPDPVGFDPLQMQAQQAAIAAAQGPMQGLATGAANANNFLTNPAILDPNTNPALQGWIDASLRPITERFENNVLPGIRSEAINNSGLGGSRQGLAEVGASRDYMRQLGDTTANIGNAGYAQGLGAMIQGTNLAPQTGGFQLAPAATLDAVGAQRRDLANMGQQTQIANQYLPFITAQDLLGSANAIPGGTSAKTTVTGAPGSQPPGMLQAGLGGAATGAAIGSAFPGYGTAVGGGLGALLGILGNRA